MKVSDYIVDFLINKGVTDVFGYPGGMVTHLMDSLGNNKDKIRAHINYHEQAASFAACGYAQASNNVGVAFATSGPGATNLITGIGNAYFDSIPTIFITGQVNTFESKKDTSIRQKGFQETSIVPIVSEITKAAFYLDKVSEVCTTFEKAYQIATSNRKGPVLIDIPMNILRSDIESTIDIVSSTDTESNMDEIIADFEEYLRKALSSSSRPCFVLGNGIRIDQQVKNIRNILSMTHIPVVSSLLAIDVITEDQGLYFGFIGAYGNRSANFVVAKSDLLICLGTRLDIRQVGGKREQFAPNAQIIRVDIDGAELANKIREDERSYMLQLNDVIPVISKVLGEHRYSYSQWISVCNEIKNKLKNIDSNTPNEYIKELSCHIPNDLSVVADVGQHMVWIAQSFITKSNQRIYFSGGMGSMGYALPAAIGIYYATKKPVVCFTGDGGFQMNIQELQFLVREQIPIKIIVLNNSSLGMIRHFQEMYFESRFRYTVESENYTVPNFVSVAEAYGIKGKKIHEVNELKDISFNDNYSELFEIIIQGNTYVYPKLEYGKPNQDQEPLLDRSLYEYLMEL